VITRGRLLTLASIVITFAAWELASMLAGADVGSGAPRVPGVLDVLDSLKLVGNSWGGGLGVGAPDAGAPLTWAAAGLALVENTFFTGLRLTAGFALGLVTGVGLAVLVSWSTIARRMLALPAHFARMLPLLAIIPLFALWFGDRLVGVVLFVALSVFVTLFAITVNAINNVPRYLTDYAHSLGASPVRTYLTVVVPAALPSLRPGVVLALGLSWSAVIAAEFLGQQRGLGTIALVAQGYGNTGLLAVVAAIVVVYAALSYLVVGRLMAFVTRWAD
jgi:sulfonate transport system permease protein